MRSLKQLCCFIVLFALLGANSVVFAGVTGKIAGRIVDAETGEPLAGANVIVEGTALGCAANLNGYYTILNVPPGKFTVKAMMMGYKISIVENIQVSTDMTTKHDFSMESTVVEGETVVKFAERPMIQKDMTAKKAIITSDEIDDLPVQSLGAVLNIQAGVTDGGKTIRGGRKGEVAFLIDGVGVNNPYTDGMGITVETSAIQEIQVISGTFNAEYGKAMSGVVNVITKDGGSKYKGRIKTYVGDYVSNFDKYQVLNDVKTIIDPKTGQLKAVGESMNPVAELINWEYDLDATLSGPVPFTKNRLTFFSTGRYNYNEGTSYGRYWFTPAGYPGDSSLVPLNPRSHWTTTNKLTYKITPSMSLKYSLMYNKRDIDRSGSKYKPEGGNQNHSYTYRHGISLNHVLSQSTFYELQAMRYYTHSEKYLYKDPHKMPHYLAVVMDYETVYMLDPDDPVEAQLLEDVKLRAQDPVEGEFVSYEWIIDPNNQDGYIHPDHGNEFTASYSSARDGTSYGHNYNSTGNWTMKFDLTSQVNRMHEVKGGFEFVQHDIARKNYSVEAKQDYINGSWIEVVPFTPVIPSDTSTSHNDYTKDPREFSAYLQDKIEVQDMIVNVGLRFDYFDANSVIPADPMDPNIYDPFLDEHIYKEWEEPEEDLNDDEMREYRSTFERYTPDERRAFMHKKVDPKMQLSPRIGFSYPITDKGAIHFSYGHFFKIPSLGNLLGNPDFKIGRGGGLANFPNPDLRPERTVSYEIGVQQQLSEDIAMDATLYYRDIRDYVGPGPIQETYKNNVKYSMRINKDYANVRGMVITIDKRYSRGFGASLDYTYQVYEGTYSNLGDAFNALQNNEEPRLKLLPMGSDVRHRLNGTISFRYSGWVLSLLGNYRTGSPYTPTSPRGESVGTSALRDWGENSDRKPMITSVDMFVDRKFKLSAFMLGVFIRVYNLLDQKGHTGVYSDTGSADYTTTVNLDNVAYNPYRVGTVEHNRLNPGMYQNPRKIQIGLSLDF